MGYYTNLFAEASQRIANGTAIRITLDNPFLTNKIPRFRSREIIDVEYVEVCSAPFDNNAPVLTPIYEYRK